MVAHDCKQEENIHDIKEALFGKHGVCRNVDQMANDISWLKGIGKYMVGMIAAILVTLISTGLVFLFANGNKLNNQPTFAKSYVTPHSEN